MTRMTTAQVVPRLQDRLFVRCRTVLLGAGCIASSTPAPTMRRISVLNRGFIYPRSCGARIYDFGHCCIERSAHSNGSHLPAQIPRGRERMPNSSWFPMGIMEPILLF